MNATEDGDEPVGEAPEYVFITDPPREALTTIPVLGENERQAIAEIRALATESDDHKWLRKLQRGFDGTEICAFTVNGADIIAILDKWGV